MKGLCGQVIESAAGLCNQTGQGKCHDPANLSLRKMAWAEPSRRSRHPDRPSRETICDDTPKPKEGLPKNRISAGQSPARAVAQGRCCPLFPPIGHMPECAADMAPDQGQTNQ